MGVDQEVLRQIADHRTGWATDLARTVAEVGMSTTAYLAAAVLCVLFGWVFRAWRPALAAPVAAVLAIGIAEAAKDLIGRARPPQALAELTSTGYAMPSSIGAMTSAAAVPVVLAGLRMGTATGRVLAAVVAVATVGVGVCMVYLGAHWLTDVLAGWALGTAIGLAVYRVIAGPVRHRRVRAFSGR